MVLQKSLIFFLGLKLQHFETMALYPCNIANKNFKINPRIRKWYS